MPRYSLLFLACLFWTGSVWAQDSNNGDDSDPCEGKMFTLICDIMRQMDQQMREKQNSIETRFDQLVTKQGKLNKQVSQKINREKVNIQSTHDEDMAKLKMKLADEMEKMKDTLSASLAKNNKDVTNQTTIVRERHVNDMRNAKSDLYSKLDNSTSASRNRLAQVETEIDTYANTFKRKLTSDMVSIQGDVDKKYGIMRIEANTEILKAKRLLVQEIRANYRKFEDIRRQLGILRGRFDAEPTWPKGKYCILANGKCPSGFLRIEGFLRAIAMKSSGSDNLGQATFGSSDIRCHEGCGKYKPWAAELNLATCCKN